MLLDGYIARWKKYPENEVKVRVARPSILSPSKELLNAYKEGKIDWSEYESRFRDEMQLNPKAMNKLREIKDLSINQNVRLICYEKNPPCHRFILIDIIQRSKEEELK